MEAKRYIGIDLHRNCFTACLRLENGREYGKEWKLEELAKFVEKLRPTDQVAVEVTGNTRLFHDAVAPHVARVVAVNPSQFQVITHSVKIRWSETALRLTILTAPVLLRALAFFRRAHILASSEAKQGKREPQSADFASSKLLKLV